jgi:hypothetical protein
MSSENAPDLRTLEGQLYYLDYHAPDEAASSKHGIINNNFCDLWLTIAVSLPDGPGKTRALHAVNDARMQCNNCIANKGA